MTNKVALYAHLDPSLPEAGMPGLLDDVLVALLLNSDDSEVLCLNGRSPDDSTNECILSSQWPFLFNQKSESSRSPCELQGKI